MGKEASPPETCQPDRHALNGYPQEHVRHIRRIADRVRRGYTCGRAYRRCSLASGDILQAMKTDSHISRLGITPSYAGGSFQGQAHCWVHLEHPEWPEPMAVDVTLDQFHFEVACFDRDPRKPRQPAVFLGPYTGTEYDRIITSDKGE